MSGTYAGVINSAAQSNGIPPALVKAVATQESSLGATGISNIMQVNGMDGSTPEESIRQGTSMLASYLKETGSVEWALAMYNMGPGIYQWARAQGITDPKEAMPAFSHAQGGDYGDPQYIQHVERYL